MLQLVFGGKLFRCICRFSGFLIVFAVLISSAFAQERTMIVLDGSGSMWGQINGRAKLEIARETLRAVLKGVPDSTELGLIAYGHREKGNCADIEMIVAPAPATAAKIADAVDKLRFLGKTPLGTAVQIAAQELRFTEDRATVVLITDGIETCGVNVCEMGKLLESQGVDFTAHVVGFGLSKEEGRQIACLAENTGGRYFSANDAESLVIALNETVAAAPPPEVTFIARDQDNNIINNIALDWQINIAGGAKVFGTRGKMSAAIALEPGNYTITVSGVDVSGGREFAIEEGADNQIIYVPVELVVLSATLDAPAEVFAGSEFEVTWSGPGAKNDFITITEAGAPVRSYGDYAYAAHGSPSKITAPDAVGEYEIRYVHGKSKRIIASRKTTVTGVSATLKAPSEVAAGAEFEVVWKGPNNKSDYITIIEAGAKKRKFGDYAYTNRGSPARITAPDGLGEFEIRYVSGQSKRIIVSRKITVTGISAKLEAPDEVAAGAEFEVIWTGPDNKSDYITIVEAGTKKGKFGDYAYTKRGSPARITAPDGLGAYEVRYVLGKSKRILTSTKITLTATSATMKVENTPVPGGKLMISWTGPNNKGDYIAIVEAGTPEGKYGKNYVSTSRGSPAALKLPRALGKFELRYIVAKSKRTLLAVPLTLEPATVTISVPASVKPGSVIKVTWTGPGNREDFIEIVAADAKANARPLGAARTAQGSPLSIFAPGSAGNYVVRYKMRDNGEILANAPLKVK